jgi:hypothetical protein
MRGSAEQDEARESYTVGTDLRTARKRSLAGSVARATRLHGDPRVVTAGGTRERFLY